MEIYKNYNYYKILLEREKILCSKTKFINKVKIKRLSEDDIKSLVRIFYIWGEPLWGKYSYFGSF